jgi:hypothetical protein
VVVVVEYEVWVSGSCFVVGGRLGCVGKWVFDDVQAAVWVRVAVMRAFTRQLVDDERRARAAY